MTQFEGLIVVGVDTHKAEHVAVAIDHLGQRLGDLKVPTTSAGYKDALAWARSFGPVGCFGIEGTGSYGSDLTRYLITQGIDVKEVTRPDRSKRRNTGKTDFLDAEAAGRSVLTGQANAVPKDTTDQVEMIRLIRIACKGAVASRAKVITTLKSTLPSLPAVVTEPLSGLATKALMERCRTMRPSKDLATPTDAAKTALRSMAKRYEALSNEITELDEQLDLLVAQAAPSVVEAFGVGSVTAAALIIAGGENVERMKSEASFAALCGVSPIPASSGKTHRMRLSRGGHREANCALHQIVITRMRSHEPTKAYVIKRTQEGKSKKEIMRCLKRYVAREIYYLLVAERKRRTLEKVA